MSSSIRRIFLNAYLAYKNDPGETLTDFIATFNESVINPQDINVGHISLNFTPLYPNFPITENKLVVNYGGTIKTLTMTATDRYEGVVSSSGSGNNVIDELNTQFKSEFSTTYEPFSFDSDLVRIVFTPSGGTSTTFVSTGSTLGRRLGISPGQFDTAFTTALTATNPPIVSRTQVIYLATDITSDSIGNNTSQHNILMMIPIYNAEYGALINYSPSYDFGSLSSPRSFTNVRFQILDELFEPIEWNGNTNLLLSMYVSYDNDDKGDTGMLKIPQY